MLNLSETTRAYFYRVALAVIALLVFFNVLDADSVPQWTEVVGAVLAIGAPALASANTSTRA